MLSNFEHQAKSAAQEVSQRPNQTANLNFFQTMGMLQGMNEKKEKKVLDQFVSAFENNPDYAIRTIFYARDICGGGNERRMFRLLMRRLSFLSPKSVAQNIELFAEYGRFDDLMVLLDSPCERDMAALVKRQLLKDLESIKRLGMISMLGKTLPSPRSLYYETKREATKLARLMGMTWKEYIGIFDELKEYFRFIENMMSQKEFSFRYDKLPGGEMLNYRKAIERNDPERYTRFLKHKEEAGSEEKTTYESLCDIVMQCIDGRVLSEQEYQQLNEAWNTLPKVQGNAIALVDASDSMYMNSSEDGIMPIAAAIALGVCFAEQGKGCFKNRFLTMDKKPKLIELDGEDIVESARCCASFREMANIDLYAVYMELLVQAVKSHLPSEDMPESLVIITDAAFDIGVIHDPTVLEDAREKFEDYGYQLPALVYWNVSARKEQSPVELTEKGISLVSGVNQSLFELILKQKVVPQTMMRMVLESERYRDICA